MPEQHSALPNMSNCLQQEPDPQRLTARHMGQLASLSAIVGSVIMFSIDPAGTSVALLATIGR